MVISISLFLVLIAVGFFTLLERKVLGYIMNRKGPNKPSFSGFFTPFADALKLICKSIVFPQGASCLWVHLGTLVMLTIPSLLWGLVYIYSRSHSTPLPLLVLLLFTSLSVYGVLGVGWGSNSSYSELGATRSIAQTISYEVVLALLVLTSF